MIIPNIAFRTLITYTAIEGTKAITTKLQIPATHHEYLWIPMLMWIIYPIIDKLQRPKQPTINKEKRALNQLIKEYIWRKTK